jgi:alpha-2-macroglobulin
MYSGAEKNGVLWNMRRLPRVVFLFGVLAFLTLVSLGCSVTLPQLKDLNPAPVSPSATPLPAQPVAPTQPAVLTPTQAVALPPALVEVAPISNSELDPKIAPVFYFNQSMDRGSVESSIQSQPALSARYEWINDATLRLVPDQPVSLKNGLVLTIGSGARAANGKSLAEPIQVDYPAPQPAHVVERLPKPGASEVNPSSAIVVTFNRPMVALGADPASTPPAFTIETGADIPPANGRGEWLNTSTYIFYPQPALFGGKQYQVKINPDLAAFDGSPLPADQISQEWGFTTSAPLILSLEPGTEKPVRLDDVFSLTFNQAMDQASVEKNFSLVRADGSTVDGTFAWNEALTKVTFSPANLLERDTPYSVVLYGATQSQGGAALGQDFAATLTSVPQFGVIQTSPAAGETLPSYFGYSSVTLTLSSPIAVGQDLNSLVTLNPAINGQSLSRSFDGDQIYINGYFQPSTSYTLTIAPGLSDKWNATLGLPYSFTFSTVSAQPSLVIPAQQAAGQTIFVPYGETNLPAQAINIQRLALSRGSLSLGDFIRAGENYQGIQNWEPLVKANWARLLYPTLNQNEKVEIPLQQADEPLEPGLYFLKIDTQPALDENANASPSLIVVSPTQMTLKTSLRQAFVWAVSIASQEPVSGAKVAIYNQAAQVVGNCTTDASGVCQTDLPAVDMIDPVYYAVIGQPGDPLFSLAKSGWAQGVSPWDLNMVYQRENPDPLVYLYTDRPIYRPGQTVSFKSVVRNQDNGVYTPAQLKEITVDVVSPYDPVTGQTQVLATVPLPLNQFGTGTGIYMLSGDAHPGVYILRPHEVKFKEIYFTVAEYRKPEIDLQVKLSQADLLFGEDIQAQVKAAYFFGAPAGNVSVHWNLLSVPGYPDLPGNLQVGRVDTSWMEPWSMSGQGGISLGEGSDVTAPDGSLVIKVPGGLVRDRLENQPRGMFHLTLEVTVEDESGLPVSARDALNLHPSSSYIGVQPEKWTTTAGEEITYLIKSVGWHGEPVANLALSAHFSKVTWVEQDRPDPYSPPEYRMDKVDAGSTDFTTSDNGDARLAFLPAEPGTFVVEISSQDGAVTQVLTWVGGAGQASWPNLPNQRLLLRADATRYKPGDAAKIFIPNPMEGDALALVSVERGKVMRAEVVKIHGASLEYNLPLKDEDAPNIYVSVTLLGHTGGRPDFRTGYLDLKIDSSAHLLQLDVKLSPAQTQPGEDVTLTIRARDQSGSPVQGEFSLALVDKAVLALSDPNAPQIEEAFYGDHYLGVQSSFSLAVYAGRFLYIPPGRGGGGGGDGLASSSLREKFEDTAYWNGAIETDVTGTAQVTIKLPDNLTTWRADVRGISAQTQVGSATVDLITSKPLLVRPVTPSFVVSGDHLELAAVVQNNTKDPVRASVRLEGAGFTLDDINLAVQPVDLQAGERRRISWWGHVQDVEALDLVFSAEAGALRDATRPEAGKLPVVRYTAPQTFGTSGVVAEEGSRLELVSIPRSFSPAGGNLRVEFSPSLAALVVDGLKAQDEFPRDFNEPVVSRLLPNLALLGALQESQADNGALLAELKDRVAASVDHLVIQQNEDGGWGWSAGSPSDAYLSSSILLGLTRAARAGVFIDAQILQKGQDYLSVLPVKSGVDAESWELDQLALRYYALQQAGRSGVDFQALLPLREKLSPWGKAFLALALEGAAPGDANARTLLGDLEASASRSATGAHWQDASPRWHSWSTPNFTTAVVVYAISQLNPQSAVLPDALRYLILTRQPGGGWNSSYESAWALLALVEASHRNGDLKASYSFRTMLNGSPLVTGQVNAGSSAIGPVSAVVPLSQLKADAPNALQIEHGKGTGQLYYRAFLEVTRPAQDAQPVSRGMTITRQYFRAGQDCRQETCLPVTGTSLADPQPLLVRLTVTIPEDMYTVVVEDRVPAGVEILNTSLKTTQQNISQETQPTETSPYTAEDPFGQGWGWWLFQNPQISADRIRWVVNYLPAGTYELTYRVTPFLAGEFQLIPAHAYEYYFPEVEGYSAGGILSIEAQ